MSDTTSSFTVSPSLVFSPLKLSVFPFALMLLHLHHRHVQRFLQSHIHDIPVLPGHLTRWVLLMFACKSYNSTHIIFSPCKILNIVYSSSVIPCIFLAICPLYTTSTALVYIFFYRLPLSPSTITRRSGSVLIRTRIRPVSPSASVTAFTAACTSASS